MAKTINLTSPTEKTSATRFSLGSDVVEKDYVLGWTLAGIYAHEVFAYTWIFKGSTCLKKCFFKTYSFSKDLDFTLRHEARLDADFLQHTFTEIGKWVYENTYIEMLRYSQTFGLCQSTRQPVLPMTTELCLANLAADRWMAVRQARPHCFGARRAQAGAFRRDAASVASGTNCQRSSTGYTVRVPLTSFPDIGGAVAIGQKHSHK